MTGRLTQLLDRTAHVAGLVLALTALLPIAAAGQGDGYHILLTNDDGIRSAGIQQLARALGEVGEVHLVAPCGERSGSSMAVALRDELTVESVEVEGIGTGSCVDTTPAGAVLLALMSLAPAGGFDLVVSGINRGANVGEASHMSGTVGGAMMGALYRIPAIAASFGVPGADYDYAARFVAGFAEELRSRPPTPGVVFSINVPRATAAEIRGVRAARMGGMHLTLDYVEVAATSGRVFRPRIGMAAEGPPDSDTAAYLDDWITITPLLFDWTDSAMVEEVRSWGLSHRVGGN